MDIQTNEIFGHIVASDIFGEAYIVPLKYIFRSIRTQLADAKVVRIATRSDFSRFDARLSPISSSHLDNPHTEENTREVKESGAFNGLLSQGQLPESDMDYHLEQSMSGTTDRFGIMKMSLQTPTRRPQRQQS